MDTVFWFNKQGEKPTEYSHRVAGGGRSTAPSPGIMVGISRVPVNKIESLDLDHVQPAPTLDPHHSIPVTSKGITNVKGPRLENRKNEKECVQKARLNFL